DLPAERGEPAARLGNRDGELQRRIRPEDGNDIGQRHENRLVLDAVMRVHVFYLPFLSIDVVGHGVGAVRLPPRLARGLLHLGMHAERTRVEEALHETGDEVTAIDLDARGAEWAVG